MIYLRLDMSEHGRESIRGKRPECRLSRLPVLHCSVLPGYRKAALSCSFSVKRRQLSHSHKIWINTDSFRVQTVYRTGMQTGQKHASAARLYRLNIHTGSHDRTGGQWPHWRAGSHRGKDRTGGQRRYVIVPVFRMLPAWSR